MKAVFCYLLLIFTFIVSVSVVDAQQIIENITPQEAYDLIQANQNNPNLVILDVRTPTEYTTEHIEDAINLDFYSTTFEEDLDELDKTNMYVIYCKSGGRSGQALTMMEALGFEEVYNIIGGISAWKTAGYPTTTGSREINIILNNNEFQKGDNFIITATVANAGPDILGSVGIWLIGFAHQILVFKEKNIPMSEGFNFTGDIIDRTFPKLPIGTYGILALFFDSRGALLDYDLELFTAVVPSSAIAEADIENTAKELIVNISLENLLETQVSSTALSSFMSSCVENALEQNYPNPFNPETWIPFKLSRPANVVISIYDVRGRLIRKIGLGELSAGIYVSKDKAVYWDGTDSLGQKVANGIYYYHLKAGDYSATKRMLILK